MEDSVLFFRAAGGILFLRKPEPPGRCNPAFRQRTLLAKGDGVQSKHELLNKVYSAFNQREIDVVLGFMRADVDWPNGMEGGRVHGHDEVRAYWLRQWSTVDPHAEPVGIKDDEAGNTVVDVHQVVHNLVGELVMDRMVQHVYSVRDGLIERMEIIEPESEVVH